MNSPRSSLNMGGRTEQGILNECKQIIPLGCAVPLKKGEYAYRLSLARL